MNQSSSLLVRHLEIDKNGGLPSQDDLQIQFAKFDSKKYRSYFRICMHKKRAATRFQMNL